MQGVLCKDSDRTVQKTHAFLGYTRQSFKALRGNTPPFLDPYNALNTLCMHNVTLLHLKPRSA